MGFSMESRETDREISEVSEAVEPQADSERLSETEETAENFDDCARQEVSDRGGETDAQALEDAEDDFEDCESTPRRMEAEAPARKEDGGETFDDCGKERDTDGAADVPRTPEEAVREEQAVREISDAEAAEQPGEAEALNGTESREEALQACDEVREHPEVRQEAAETYAEQAEGPPAALEGDDEVPEMPPETDEAAGDTSPEGSEAEESGGDAARAEVQEAADGTEEELDREVLETLDDQAELESDRIDTDKIAEETAEAAEESADLELPEEAKEELSEDLEEKLEAEEQGDPLTAEEAREIVQDQTEELTESLEQAQEEVSGETERSVEEALEDDEVPPSEDALREKVQEDALDAAQTGELTDAQAEAVAEERAEAAEEAIEHKQADAELERQAEDLAESVDEDLEDAAQERAEKDLEQRTGEVLEKGDASLSAVRDAAEDTEDALQAAKAGQEAAAAQASEKFEAVTAKKRGTEDYRQALAEYNAIQAEREALIQRAEELSQRRAELQERRLALREAQLERGREASEASAESLANARALGERFDDVTYGGGAGRAELDRLRAENCACIQELSEQKDALKLAMDAKMDQISDYVRANNMGRYETSIDPYYKQLSQEHQALRASYDQVRYAAVKLDDNNIRLSGELGAPYESIREAHPRSPVWEVNHGLDRPGETNYFPNETRAAEVLSPFRQNAWENLTLREQKQALEQLADYHAETLGIAEKPQIVYYHKEDPGDFGGFSAQQNAIYINEYNMGDAAETADTISHEYRHKYQHERAEKLENERDLAFKEGFDNYIRPEDDFRAYQDQLVEQDAQAYAEAVKEQLASYAGRDGGTSGQGPEQRGFVPGFSETHPERGTVFDEGVSKELPEDLTRREVRQYREGLEARELEEIRRAASSHYENAQAVGVRIAEFDTDKQIGELDTYKEHWGLEHGHIENVRIKSLQAADALEQQFQSDTCGGLFAASFDRKALEVMAIYHDTGMDGNIEAGDFDREAQAYLSNAAARDAYVSKFLEKRRSAAGRAGEAFDLALETERANRDFEEKGYLSHFRQDHALESAIHALRDRSQIENVGVSADEVALGCLVHSKSTSGLRQIADEGRWRDVVGLLQERVRTFNDSHPDEPITFDPSFLVREDGSFRQEKLSEMRTTAVALRIGDANGHDTNSRISQSGKRIDFSLEAKTDTEPLPEDLRRRIERRDLPAYFAEVQAADVRIDGIPLDNTTDPEGTSRMFAVGEGNFKRLECTMGEDGMLRQHFVLCDGNAFPLSTQACIIERLEEYETAKPLRYAPVVHLGPHCSQETLDAYQRFARAVGDKYGVEMEFVQ